MLDLKPPDSLSRLSIHSVAKVCGLLIVVSISLWCQSTIATTHTSYMDPAAREAFLATVDAEEDWLDRVSRRLSGGTLVPPLQAPPPPTTPLATEQPDNHAGLSPGGGPLRRSGRKRKSTSEATDLRRLKMSSSGQPSSSDDKPVLEQLKELMKQMKEVRDDVNRSEGSTASKIDSLSRGVTERLNKTELSVKCLMKDVATVKSDLTRLKLKTGEDS